MIINLRTLALPHVLWGPDAQLVHSLVLSVNSQLKFKVVSRLN